MVEYFKDIMEWVDEDYVGFWLGLKNVGCVGMVYIMDYVIEKGFMDEVVEDKGV